MLQSTEPRKDAGDNVGVWDAKTGRAPGHPKLRRCQTPPCVVAGEKRFSFILKNMTAACLQHRDSEVLGRPHDIAVPGDDLATSEMDKSGDALLPNGAGRSRPVT